MNVFNVGLEDLTPAERRRVRRAINRQQHLDDPRLRKALLRHVGAYLDDSRRYEAAYAIAVGVAVGVAVAIAALLFGGFVSGPAEIAFWAVAMAAAQLLIGRPLRRSQYESARRRHTSGKRA